MAEVTIIDAPPPAAPPAPTTQVNLAPPATPAPAPKPGSARERMFGELRKKATASDPATPPPAPRPGDQPPAPDPAEPPVPDPDDTPIPDPAEPKPGETPATPDPKAAKPKANPWKLYEAEKAKRLETETRLKEIEAKLTPETDRETFTKRLTETEKRAKELEDEIRYVNYSKSEEFKTKYELPYENAWKSAMQELSEIGILDPQTNEQRAVDAQDLLNLVNMPLGQARQTANAMFGDFADDVMAHRKAIKNLFEQRQHALTEAKEKGAEREKVQREQYDQMMSEATKSVKQIWETTNQTIHKDEKFGKYFVPIEGDEEGNQRLGKGFQLVDRAFSDPSPTDLRLTPEQRAEIVKRHAAVRNRAAAFGRLVLQVTKQATELEALKKELAQYKASTPATTNDTRPPAGNGAHTSARDRVFGELRKLAK